MENLREICLPKPSKSDWKAIARNFQQKWNFPNCVGALDGKHIAVQCPDGSGSLFYNYKNFYSVVLFALCDADYVFTMIDVGSYGRESDSSIFSRTSFYDLLSSANDFLPSPSPITDAGQPVPFTIVADEAFPLMRNLMRPFPGRLCEQDQQIFNYRLSRARRTIENAFSILSSRWRIFRKPIIGSPEKVEKIVCAAVVLHNFLRKPDVECAPQERKYTPTSFVDHVDLASQDIVPGQWRQTQSTFSQAGRLSSNRASAEARSVRETFKHYMYFVNDGALEWQTSHVNRVS